MKLIGYLRNIPAGTGVNGATVTLKKKSDDSTVASDTSASDGYSYDDAGEFSFAADGSPGPTYITTTSGGQTKRRESRESGAAGTWYPAEHPYYEYAHGDGVLYGVDNAMAATASGTMNIAVNTGIALVKGHMYRCSASTNVAISASDPSNPRIDRVVVRLTRIGQSTEGLITLAALTGTPAASPAAPALTQSSATWEISLAQVLVGTGVASIAADKVTDERGYALSDLYSALTYAPKASPTFTGTITAAAATFSGTVSTTGNTNLGNGASDLITLTGWLKSGGASPTISMGPQAGAGASGSIVGTDTAGVITFTTGTTNVAGDIFAVSFNQTRASADYVPMLFPADGDAMHAMQYVRVDLASRQTTAWTVTNTSSALDHSTQHVWYYWVVEYEP